ncbi:Catabolic NAD-specific glutamate dehydrogenase RocG [Anaerolineae bacterium]|nr:Catabolic NAD-specific glutamate dehydrogenase RocG [Anaerolineae bacterium]
MLPKRMNEFLHDLLPEHVWQTRRKEENGLVFLEFTSQDVELLHRLGIEVDNLGPRLVVCMWNERDALEIGGYLIVDNVAMGLPAMGGIRLAPDVTPAAIHNLARGMTLKNAAADLPYGGGKSGIVAPTNLSPAQHTQVVRGFAHLIRRYVRLYNPGPDVGTNDQDMKTVAIENGLDAVVSKPVDMGGNRIDQLGAAGGGCVIALEALYHEAERLRVLPQFRNLEIPAWDKVTLIVQGFGAVGAHAARIVAEREGAAPKVIGISDATGYLYCESGLDVPLLLALRKQNPLVAKPYFLAHPDEPDSGCPALKFSSSRDDLLRESAFALVPAAPQANYLDVDESSRPSMTIDKMGRWTMIVEGANTYSPDPKRKAARRRMERKVYQERGTLIATDYLVNSGGVIFAAHERLMPTPHELRIPAEMLGNREAVDKWLKDHASDFAVLAEKRRVAAEKKRDDVIRKNMVELVDGLIAEDDALPCQVAERISINRIVSRESHRVASEVMVEMATTQVGCSVQDAARTLVEKNTDILSVLASDGHVVGIVTDWDITQAASRGQIAGVQVDAVMTREIIHCGPQDTILEVVTKLEQHDISALPVLSSEGRLLGAITSNLLATRTLYRLLLGEQQG